MSGTMHFLTQFLRLITSVAGVASASAALAQKPITANAVLPVTLEIIGTCTVRATDLSFGNYAANAANPLLGQTSIELICAPGLAVEVGLDAGQGPGATVMDRRMVSGPDALRYSLFQDAARSQNWGETTGVDTVHVEAIGQPQTLTVFGEVAPRQQVAPGQYSDVITIYVYF